tara:strand:+ start:6585 stop:6923 length:339 start_codon:yes stop_codon:yes gene_type:complete
VGAAVIGDIGNHVTDFQWPLPRWFLTMPLFTFINWKGETIERIAKPDEKSITEDGQVWFRGAAPEQFAFTGRSLPASLKDKIFKGYQEQENRHGSRWRSSFSKKQIKKIWED